jgi:chromosome segregation ATPase
MKEREIREATEQKLVVSEDRRRKLEDQYKAAQEEILVLKNKLKEQDDKISGLLDDFELEKGLREEIKKENVTLKSQVDSAEKERKNFQEEMVILQEKNTFLQNELSSAKDLREQMAASLEEAQTKLKALEAQLSSATAVNLEEIVVSPQDPAGDVQNSVGQILKLNEENNFVITDLGSSSGITENDVVEFYRGEALLGEGKITRVQNIMSVADLLPPLVANKLQVSDRVTIKR